MNEEELKKEYEERDKQYQSARRHQEITRNARSEIETKLDDIKYDRDYEERKNRHKRIGKELESYEAESGFHGIINHPTKFLVGERGIERVDITPIKKKRRTNDDYMNFDLMKEMKRFWK
jgi:hypothetical protein